MASYLNVVPAYGRDYKSKAAVLKDWNEEKDFLICDMSSKYDGSYINKADKPADVTLTVRYKSLTMVMTIR